MCLAEVLRVAVLIEQAHYGIYQGCWIEVKFFDHAMIISQAE